MSRPKHRASEVQPSIANNPMLEMRMYERRPAPERTAAMTASYDRAVEACRSRCNEPETARGLLNLILSSDSPGAARALRPTSIREIRREVVDEVERFLTTQPTKTAASRGSKTKRPPSFVLPLVLGGAGDSREIRLLTRALRYRPLREPAPVDTEFRRCVAASLALSKQQRAQEALLGVLVDPHEDPELRDTYYNALCSNLTPEVLEGYRWVEQLPERKALRKLAKAHEGAIKGALVGTKKYLPVLNALRRLLEHVDEKYAGSDSGVVDEPRAEPLSQAPPTNVTPAPSAPPAFGRQAVGERPKAGSDERDLLPVEDGLCSDCVSQMLQEGRLSAQEAQSLQPVPRQDCFRCR